MDALVEVLVPEFKLFNDFKVQKQSYTWENIEYEQEPLEYIWQDKIIIKPDKIMGWIEKFVPNEFSPEGWTALEISSLNIKDLEQYINQEQPDDLDSNITNDKHPLEEFLTLLLNKHKKWIFMFVLHHDQIDKVYKLDVNQCVDKLKENLKFTALKEGFIAISNN